MTTRARALRQLGAAAAVTLAVTTAGVLLGPVASGTTLTAGNDAVETAAADEAGDTLSTEVRAPSVPLPDVANQRHADFTEGEDLPDGARVFNSGGNRSGMALAGGVLGHGAAEAAAAGFVETELEGEVRSLGARVRFAGPASGSVALVGWQTSLVEADRKGTETPATGLRLVASPGRWELSVVQGGDVDVIATGTYVDDGGAVTFEVRRSGSELFVADPTGLVTSVTDKRAARLKGPWASWGLTETGPEQTPASIEAVWAG